MSFIKYFFTPGIYLNELKTPRKTKLKSLDDLGGFEVIFSLLLGESVSKQKKILKPKSSVSKFSKLLFGDNITEELAKIYTQHKKIKRKKRKQRMKRKRKGKN